MTKAVKLAVAIALGLASVAGAKGGGEKVYLTQNLFTERGKSDCANYQVGELVPAGSQVEILKVSNKVVVMDTEAGKIKVIYSEKTTGMDVDEWLKKVTSETDPKAGWARFSAVDKDGIKKGKALVGMSKAAVLVALGTPPLKLTPDTSSNQWFYAKNRFFVRFGVKFANGKVTEVGGQGK